MPNALLDVYGAFSEISVCVTQHPPKAEMTFRSEGRLHNIQFNNPQPRAALMDLFDCWNIRVVDYNSIDNWQLEFGRYYVELWDEDNPISNFNVDRFEYYIAD